MKKKKQQCKYCLGLILLYTLIKRSAMYNLLNMYIKNFLFLHILA